MHLLRQLLYRLAASLTAFQERGFQAGFTELGRTVLRIFYQKSEHIILACELSERKTSPVNPKLGLVISRVKSPDEIACLGSMADPNDMARFHKMLDHGSIAFIAYLDKQSAGYCWISEEIDPGVNRVQPPLRPGDACVHDLFVSPTYRRQGIGHALVSHRLRYLSDHGYSRAIAAVRKDNIPALKVDEKTGYTHIGEMSHTRVLFWDRFIYNLSSA